MDASAGTPADGSPAPPIGKGRSVTTVERTWPPLNEYLRDIARESLADAGEDAISDAVARMIAHPEYPCLGARSVFRRDAARIVVLDSMADPDAVAQLAVHLEAFSNANRDPEDFVSFIAVFREPVTPTEKDFEARLWQVLQQLHDEDTHPWADGVAADPEAPQFAFSHAGRAYFIVGLHPRASRIARRAPLPTLVFNLHEQFEKLRAEGGFDRMRTAIRRRDTKVQGSVNPMAADHGEASEARQYSGRRVEPTWQAPFSPKEIGDDRSG